MNVTDVHSLNASQLVNVVGKIMNVGKSFEVHSKRRGKDLRKQECIIGDSGSRCRVVLWEGDVGKLKEDASYRLNDLLVNEYGGQKYLSLTEDAVVEEVTDIGIVASEDEGDEQIEEGDAVEGEIVAVTGMDYYCSCVKCYGKVKIANRVMGECGKCGAKVKLSRCKKQMSVRFIVENGEKQWSLTAFGKQLEMIVGEEEGDSIEEKKCSWL